jgi:hypothetical protein
MCELIVFFPPFFFNQCMLIGRLFLDGRMTARAKYDFTQNFSVKVNAQVQSYWCYLYQMDSYMICVWISRGKHLHLNIIICIFTESSGSSTSASILHFQKYSNLHYYKLYGSLFNSAYGGEKLWSCELQWRLRIVLCWSGCSEVLLDILIGDMWKGNLDFITLSWIRVLLWLQF